MGSERPAPLRCELNLVGRPCGASWVNKDYVVTLLCALSPAPQSRHSQPPLRARARSRACAPAVGVPAGLGSAQRESDPHRKSTEERREPFKLSKPPEAPNWPDGKGRGTAHPERQGGSRHGQGPAGLTQPRTLRDIPNQISDCRKLSAATRRRQNPGRYGRGPHSADRESPPNVTRAARHPTSRMDGQGQIAPRGAARPTQSSCHPPGPNRPVRARAHRRRLPYGRIQPDGDVTLGCDQRRERVARARPPSGTGHILSHPLSVH